MRIRFGFVLLAIFTLNVFVRLAACELPAEPCASLVPIALDNMPGVVRVESVNDGGGYSYFYLVPEGTKCSFQIAWNPAMLNSGLQPNRAKHHYVWRYPGEGKSEHLAGAPEYQPDPNNPDIYGYFDIDEMASFFSVSGNRNDISEAFAREVGADTNNKFIPAGILASPYTMIRQFAKSGQEAEITAITDKHTGDYSNSGRLSDLLNNLNETRVTDASMNYINNSFPSSSPSGEYNGFSSGVVKILSADGKSYSEEPVYLLDESQASKDQDSDDENKLAIRVSGEGMKIENLQIQITDIKKEDYKAYIFDNGAAASRCSITSDPPMKVLKEDANVKEYATSGNEGKLFAISFDTPTYNGDIEQSKICFKVYAPSAGYELTNVYWVWKEEELKLKKGVTIQDPDKVEPSLITIDAYERVSGSVKQCSAGLKVVVVKDPYPQYTTDFIVYDTTGPLCASFNLTGDNHIKAYPQTQNVPFYGSAFNFKLQLKDSNPFFASAFDEIDREKHIPLSQAVAGSGLQNRLRLNILYTYPIYKYAAEKYRLGSLGEGGLADLDLTSSALSFNAYRHASEYFWQKADIVADSLKITSTEPIYDSSQKMIGSENTIEGKLVINEPYPWHICTQGQNITPNTHLNAFAVCCDTAGNEPNLSESFSVIEEAPKTKIENSSTGFWNTLKQSAVSPKTLAPLKVQNPPDWAKNDAGDWCNTASFEVNDEIGPEIEVLVFDTRTNRYHLFANGKNISYSFARDKASNCLVLGTYSGLAPNEAPYNIGKSKAEADAEIKKNNLFEIYDFSAANIAERCKKFFGSENSSSIQADDNGAFVCLRDNRLVFYVRAVDNCNNANGINSITYKLTPDEKGEEAVVSGKLYNNINYDGQFHPIECIFRHEGKGRLDVFAKDKAENTSELSLEVYVATTSYEIQSISERRSRSGL